MAIEDQALNTREEREALEGGRRRDIRGRQRRQQALEAINEETVVALDQVFEAKLRAVRIYEQRLPQVSDPYARRVLEGMIEQERSGLLHLAELIDLVEQNPNTGALSRATRQMYHRLKSDSAKNITYGVGLALLGAMLFPTVKESFKPIFAKAMQGINDISEQAKSLVGSVKEDIEDLVAEAEFERLKQSIDTEIAQDITIDSYKPPQK